MQRLAATDPRLTWRGHVSLEAGDGWLRPWRLPCAELPFYHEALVANAGKPSGVRLALATDSRTLRLETAGETGRGAVVALTIDGQEATQTVIDEAGCAAFELDGARHRVELWLPHQAEVRVAGLQLAAGATIAPAAAPTGRRWITYGSSITHGAGASSPVLNWPARVALARDLDLVNLGYGGQCHLDPLVARCIAGLPAEAITIKVGINIYNQASLGPRTFRSNLIAFVRLVRAGHPTTPIVLISAIFSYAREHTENKVGLTLVQMRTEVATAVEILRAAGDAHISYLDGLELLGAADHARLPDKLHPDDAGYALMAERFLERLGPALFG